MLAVYKRTGPRRRRLSRVKMRARPGRLGVRGGRRGIPEPPRGPAAALVPIRCAAGDTAHLSSGVALQMRSTEQAQSFWGQEMTRGCLVAVVVLFVIAVVVIAVLIALHGFAGSAPPAQSP